MPTSLLSTAELLEGHEAIYRIETKGPGPAGKLPLSDEMLRTWSSGDLFGLTQNTRA